MVNLEAQLSSLIRESIDSIGFIFRDDTKSLAAHLEASIQLLLAFDRYKEDPKTFPDVMRCIIRMLDSATKNISTRDTVVIANITSRFLALTTALKP